VKTYDAGLYTCIPKGLIMRGALHVGVCGCGGFLGVASGCGGYGAVVGVAGGGGADGGVGVVGGRGQGRERGEGGAASGDVGFHRPRCGGAARLYIFERAVVVAPEAALHVHRRAAGVGREHAGSHHHLARSERALEE